jgi:hypothetical protein
MPNKINLTPAEAQAYFAFIIWIHANPNGGLFECGEFRLRVEKIV